MSQEQRTVQEQRGLRFSFDAAAEILLESRHERTHARVKALSFRGCYLETSASLKESQRLRVKITHADQVFESLAEVIYLRPGGAGILFGNIEPHFRNVLQGWILSALDMQAESERS